MNKVYSDYLKDLWESGNISPKHSLSWSLSMSCGGAVRVVASRQTGVCLEDELGNIWAEESGRLFVHWYRR